MTAIPVIDSGSGIGIIDATDNTYHIQVGNTVYLYVNGEIRQSWTTTAVTPTSGSPVGLLLGITYA